MKALIVCTGNSSRSQMAHGFLQSFDSRLNVYSAGNEPAGQIDENAVRVMQEVGIDISGHKPTSVNKYLDTEWDYEISVCGKENGACPYFPGKAKHHMHIRIESPSKFQGSHEELLNRYRRIRDEIRNEMYSLYSEQIKPNY
jgi:arsenate reductase